MSKTAKEYCNLLNFIKDLDEGFYDAIIRLCVQNLFYFKKFTNGITFLLPDKTQRNKIIKYSFTDPQHAIDIISSLVIMDVLEDSSSFEKKKTNIPNGLGLTLEYGEKKDKDVILKNKSILSLNKKFKFMVNKKFKNSKLIVIWDLKGDFPSLNTKKATGYNFTATKKKIKGGYPYNVEKMRSTPLLLFRSIINDFKLSVDKHKKIKNNPFIDVMCSFFKYICDDGRMEQNYDLIKLIYCLWNWSAISMFIVIFEVKKQTKTFVKRGLYTSWMNDTNGDFISRNGKKIMKDYAEYKNKFLSIIKSKDRGFESDMINLMEKKEQCQKQLYKCLKENSGKSSLINSIKNAYNYLLSSDNHMKKYVKSETLLKIHEIYYIIGKLHYELYDDISVFSKISKLDTIFIYTKSFANLMMDKLAFLSVETELTAFLSIVINFVNSSYFYHLPMQTVSKMGGIGDYDDEKEDMDEVNYIKEIYENKNYENEIYNIELKNLESMIRITF